MTRRAMVSPETLSMNPPQPAPEAGHCGAEAWVYSWRNRIVSFRASMVSRPWVRLPGGLIGRKRWRSLVLTAWSASLAAEKE